MQKDSFFPLMTSRRTTVPVAILAATLCCLPACSKKEEQQAASGGTATTATAPTSGTSESAAQKALVNYLPADTLGFISWDTSTAGYQRLAKSPWANSSQGFASLNTALAGSKLLAILKDSGVDPSNKQDIEGFFQQGAMFINPDAASAPAGKSADTTPPSSPPIGWGLVYRKSVGGVDSDKLVTLKKKLGDAAIKVQDLKLANGNGFSFDAAPLMKDLQSAAAARNAGATDPTAEKPPAADLEPHVVYIGWNAQMGATASSPALLDTLLASKGATPPSILSTADYANATKELPAETDRIQYGYFNVAAAVKKLASSDVNPAAPENQIPIKAIAFAGSMGETPQSDVKIVWSGETEDQKQIFSALGSSPSGSLLAAVPQDPLVFLSIDGQTIKRFKEIATKKGMANPATDKMLASLDNIQRLGVAARLAPPGQSMLPIPDLMLIVETSKGEEMKQLLMDAAGMGSAMTGAPPGKWSDITISGVPVKQQANPATGSILVASKDKLVIASSSQPLLTSSLESLSGKPNGFSAALPTRAKEMFAKQNDLANIYLNFEAAGSFMETMQGMAGMFAPKGDTGQTQELFSAENIDAIKKLGSLVGSATAGNGMISIKSFYQTSAS